MPAPIAVVIAHKLQANPDPFLMAVAIGASCAFLTPIGHQCNTLVMGPGGYGFGDYWRLGLPLQVLIVAAAVPVLGAAGVQGAVLFEQASEPILTLTDRALVTRMTFTLLATLGVGAGLLGYATWLSLRVRRLAHAAETALGPRGEIRSGMPGAGAADELGGLARSFAELLERLREHTEYLRTLASKLSHELRTPLAVVTTSLDNLEHEVKAPAAEAYLARLRQGAERLDAHHADTRCAIGAQALADFRRNFRHV